MLEELNRQLVETREKIRARQKVMGDVGRVQETLNSERARLVGLKGKLASEKADVDKLEGLSLTGLFHSVLGNKELQLQKERQEYLAAKLKHDECEASVAALDRDAKDLWLKADGLAGAEAEYEDVLRRKEEAIKSSGDANAAVLLGLSEELADSCADMKELQEAVDAGQAALSGLDDVVASLGSAKNWGTWDLVGGGLISTAIKHSKIDGAKQAANRVQHLLRRFERELADVGGRADGVEIEMGSFATFADYFFDGLIADWIVQSRIGKSLASAHDVRGRVDAVVGRLWEQLRKAESRAEDVAERRQKLVEGA